MMDSIAGTRPALTWAVHITVAVIVVLWLFPTVGLLVSSFRTGDQIASSGWWDALSAQKKQEPPIRIAGKEVQQGGNYVISGNLFDNGAHHDQRLGHLQPEAHGLQAGQDGRPGRRRVADGGEVGRFHPVGTQELCR